MTAAIDPGRAREENGPRRSLIGPLSIALFALVVLSVAVTLYLEAVLPPTVPPGAAESLLTGRPLLGTLLVFAVVGVLIVRRQARNAVGWILLGAAVSFAVPQVAIVYVTSAEYSPAGGYPIPGVVGLVGNFGFATAVWLTLGLLPLLFPDGRPLTPRWAWAVRFGAAALAVWQVTRALDPGAVGDADATTPIANPFGNASAAALLSPVSQLAVLAVLLTLIPGIVSVVLRYRRGTAETRLQLRWFLAACVVMLLVTVIPFLQALLNLPAPPLVAVMAVGYSLAPVAIGLAVARYRLYDIDVIINRTVVYATVSAVLVATYLAGLALFEFVLSPFTSGSSPAIAASTLGVVALFQPIRARIQSAVDRRFYRQKYDAERTLDAFAVRLRDEIDLDALRAELITAVGATVQPTHASLWLRGTR